MKLMKSCTIIVKAALLAALLATTGLAQAQAWPSNRIRLIIPYPPGGSQDPMGRLIAERLTEKLGQPVFVDNRVGGSGIVGTEAMVRAAPDGYTIMLASSSLAITSMLMRTSFDLTKDFAWIGTFARTGFILVTHPAVPASTLQEFIALAKAKPGQLNYSSASTGSAPHLATASFESLTGIQLAHIPYNGGGPSLTAVVGGQVEASFQTPVAAIPMIRANRLKGIAVTGDKRISALPQMPTFGEAGLPTFNLVNWYGVAAPAGTPKPILDRLSAEINQIANNREVQEKLAGQGMEAYFTTPEQFNALVRSDLTTYGAVIKAGNIKMNQ